MRRAASSSRCGIPHLRARSRVRAHATSGSSCETCWFGRRRPRGVGARATSASTHGECASSLHQGARDAQDPPPVRQKARPARLTMAIALLHPSHSLDSLAPRIPGVTLDAPGSLPGRTARGSSTKVGDPAARRGSGTPHARWSLGCRAACGVTTGGARGIPRLRAASAPRRSFQIRTRGTESAACSPRSTGASTRS
jgi:hypothetical protein